MPRLVLPEYGRNIQQMVDHCLTIPDREARTRCAYTIITVMGNLFPELRDNEQTRHKLWDHLAIMSGFKLDIDWPDDIMPQPADTTDPDKIPYPAGLIHRRHYGHSLEMMIQKAATMEDGPERDELINLLANHMKKSLLATYRDGIDDAKVYKDLAEYSHGMIVIDPETHPLHEFQIIAPPTQGKKKKKKK